jgi:hypothetical protein
VSWSDGIALVQAVFLAAAAFFAWRAYGLASQEHGEARKEAAKAPLRELQSDVIRELKALVAVAQERHGGATPPLEKLRAQQGRLAVALTFLPPDEFNLFATEALTTAEPLDIANDKQHIEKATSEQLRLFADIEDGNYSIRQVAGRSVRAERARERG